MTKPKWQERADKKAEKYKIEDFERNPEGYTVAPYVNEETTSTAFYVGYCEARADMQAEAEVLVKALESIKKNKYGLQGYLEEDDAEGAYKYMCDLAFGYEQEAREALATYRKNSEGLE